jgi:hypothetical protein
LAIQELKIAYNIIFFGLKESAKEEEREREREREREKS